MDEEIKTNTSAEPKVESGIIRLNVELGEKNWIPFKDFKDMVIGDPYWFKRPNGAIFMASYVSTNSVSGWAKSGLRIMEDGEVRGYTNTNSFYFALGECVMQHFFVYREKEVPEGGK